MQRECIVRFQVFRWSAPVRCNECKTGRHCLKPAEPKSLTPGRHNKGVHLLQQMDAFVMPSRGEGFGLCGLEAMSTGLALIATNWSGPAEYLEANDTFPLHYRLRDAGGIRIDSKNYYGLWAEP